MSNLKKYNQNINYEEKFIYILYLVASQLIDGDFGA